MLGCCLAVAGVRDRSIRRRGHGPLNVPGGQSWRRRSPWPSTF